MIDFFREGIFFLPRYLVVFNRVRDLFHMIRVGLLSLYYTFIIKDGGGY